jgi:peptidoglycan/LPS O-acetylase OafA/YrhL
MHSLLAITWSLSVEEQFYSVVPAVEKYARRTIWWLLPTAYALVCIPPFGILPDLQIPAFFRQTTFGPILLGALLAHVLDRPGGFSWVFRLAGIRNAPFIALALVIAVASYPYDMSGLPRIFVHWAMVALVASCVVREDNTIAQLLSFWPVRRIGVVSYGMYLYHLLVMHFVILGMKSFNIVFLNATFTLTLLGTWSAAELSYRLFEVRFLALKGRFVSDAAEPARADPSRYLIS